MKKCNKCLIEKSIEENFGNLKLKSGSVIKKSVCKSCEALKQKAWYRTRKGLIRKIYNNQKKSSKIRKMFLPSYSYEELYDWMTSRNNFEELYQIWIDSDYHYSKVPSVDRIHNDDMYHMKNIQLVDFRFNNEKDNMMKAKKIVMLDLSLNLLGSYDSIRKCCFENGFKSPQGISHILSGRTTTYLGYKFMLQSDYFKYIKKD